MDVLLWILGLYLCWGMLRILLYITKRDQSSSAGKLPPGPRPLPVIGNLLQLGPLPHRSLTELARVHGPVMSLRLGRITTVVVSSAPMAREILQIHDASFSSRVIPDTVTAFHHDRIAMAWVPVSPYWRNLRRISNAHLFAPKALDSNQHLRSQKIQELLTYVDKCSKTGDPVDIGEAGFTMTLNLLANTILSMDLADSSSKLAKFKETICQMMVEVGKPNLVDYFPVLKRLDPQGAKRRFTSHARWMLSVFDGIIDKRLQLRSVFGSDKKNDMMDTLLDLCEDKKEEMDLFQIKHLFLDLFAAGTDTTSTTLEWAMAELLCNPEKLLKVQTELDEVIGRGKPIEESDIARLPYLQATVKETFRLHPPGPLLLPRRAGATVEVGGYTIPKDSQVLVNVWAIGRDPVTWNNPDKFVPERFLAVEIDVKGQNFELLPFGGGRRICPGLPLAIRMLHLILGSLINSFDWKLEDGASPATLDMREIFGVTLKKAQPLRVMPLPIKIL